MTLILGGMTLILGGMTLFSLLLSHVSPSTDGMTLILRGMTLICHSPNISVSAASRARDCGNPANLIALAQIRVDRVPDGTRSSQSWHRLHD